VTEKESPKDYGSLVMDHRAGQVVLPHDEDFVEYPNSLEDYSYEASQKRLEYNGHVQNLPQDEIEHIRFVGLLAAFCREAEKGKVVKWHLKDEEERKTILDMVKAAMRNKDVNKDENLFVGGSRNNKTLKRCSRVEFDAIHYATRYRGTEYLRGCVLLVSDNIKPEEWN
jgi:hypothetical protein